MCNQVDFLTIIVDCFILTFLSGSFWLAVHDKPVLFWKSISGFKVPCFLFYAC